MRGDGTNVPPSKAKRKASRLSRSTAAAPTSPSIPPSPSNLSLSATTLSPTSNQAFLKNIRKLLSEFEQLHNVENKPMSDRKVIDKFKQIESARPRLIQINQGSFSQHATDALAARCLNIAENILAKSPEFDISALRSLTVSDKPLKTPTSASHNYIPKPSSSYQRPPTSPSFPPLRGTAQTSLPDRLPSPSYQQEKPSRPHHELTEQITPEQKVVMLAVKDLVRHADAGTVTSSPSQTWFHPPPGHAPEEVQKPLENVIQHNFPCSPQPRFPIMQHTPPPPQFPMLHVSYVNTPVNHMYPPMSPEFPTRVMHSNQRSVPNESMSWPSTCRHCICTYGFVCPCIAVHSCSFQLQRRHTHYSAKLWEIRCTGKQLSPGYIPLRTGYTQCDRRDVRHLYPTYFEGLPYR